MTRGKIVLITEDRMLSSIEFNGDMYIENGHGEDVIEDLKKIDSVKAYREYVEKFNAKHFRYNDFPLVGTVIDCDKEFEGNMLLDLTVNYIRKWESDYLYIKNIGSNPVTFHCVDYEVTLLPNGIMAVHFGAFGGACRDYSEGFEAVKKERQTD